MSKKSKQLENQTPKSTLERKVLIQELHNIIVEVGKIRTDIAAYDQNIEHYQKLIGQQQHSKNIRMQGLAHAIGQREVLKKLLFGVDADLSHIWNNNVEGLQEGLKVDDEPSFEKVE